jgi:hypothetical protein
MSFRTVLGANLALLASGLVVACAGTQSPEGNPSTSNPAGCPAPSFIPSVGEPCSQSALTCSYSGTCGDVIMVCQGMQWKQQSGPMCPTAPPSEGQSCCLPSGFTCYYSQIARCQQVCNGGVWVAGSDFCDVELTEAGSGDGGKD